MNTLSRLNPSDVVAEPFPHVLIENVLPPVLCEQLTAEFPRLEQFTFGQTTKDSEKLLRRHRDLLADNQLSPCWKQFITAHLAADVFSHYQRLFHDHLTKEYPHLDWRMTVGHRNVDTPATHDILLDCQLGVHVPAAGPITEERAIHIKQAWKLFEGQLFFRSPEDHSTGGEINIYEFLPGARPVFGQRNQLVDPSIVRLVKKVPYRANTLLLFMNTSRSLVRISPLHNAKVPFQFMGFLAQYREHLFQLPLADGIPQSQVPQHVKDTAKERPRRWWHRWLRR